MKTNKNKKSPCRFCKKELLYNKPIRLWDYETRKHKIIYARQECSCKEAQKEETRLREIGKKTEELFNSILK